ncbi:alginate export family protein [Kangiella sediminilitoris]|uniref:Alginate export domain-containing protein n=1 Tax=Kangiella sediminilitoris TaxID=1144748 RepID=A0A1B3BAL4_9GAMM|nr:alginate export family protein [Kangiella sediminilitoris]AOE49839.1 hypothetical protein KS2013_1119 [Kangiella sediminilitoris]
MTKKQLVTAVALTLATLASNTHASDEQKVQAGGIDEAFKESDVKWTFRYRAESVDQENVLQDATASTLLTRISLETLSYNDFSFRFEVDNVSMVSNRNDYNSLLNGQTDHSVVADPEATEINQAALLFNGFTDTAMTIGRQRINLGNQRFVGGVGWRQNEQTYDGILFTNKSITDATITYAYINNINTILDSNLDTESHFINYDWALATDVKLSLYGYLLDFKTAPTDSSRTIGARVSFSDIQNTPFFIKAEYAKQDDYADNPVYRDSNYLLGELGYAFANGSVSLGKEVLTGDGSSAGNAFQTPLATKHKFQGWADQFLTTPVGGLEDTFISFNTSIGTSSLIFQYHNFEAEDSSADYGKELGLSYKMPLTDHVSMVAKLADYESDGFSVDTRKAWLMFVAKF